MRRVFRFLLIAATSVAAVLSCRGEESAAPATPTPSTTGTSSATPAASPNPILSATAPGPAKPTTSLSTTTPRRSRAISPDVAAQLSAATPKFTPPPPKPPPAETDETDLRELDKPRNGIIRLPKYVVREPTPPVLTERAVTTQKGLADLAMKRYGTEAYRALNRFSIPLFGTSAEQHAIAMYLEDERLKNMADLTDDARMVSATDKASGMYVKRQVESTFARPGDFDWKPIGR